MLHNSENSCDTTPLSYQILGNIHAVCMPMWLLLRAVMLPMSPVQTYEQTLLQHKGFTLGQ